MRREIITICFVLLFTVAVCAGKLPRFKSQAIEVPVSGCKWVDAYLKDIDGDGLKELLAFARCEGRVFIYKHSSEGFAISPSQSIKFPEGTAWVGFCDVDKMAGEELLVSTSNGLSYFRVKEGIFQKEPEVLLEAEQVFWGGGGLGFLFFEQYKEQLEGGIPVIFADRTVIYEIDGDFELTRGKELKLQRHRSLKKWWGTNWSLGAKESRGLLIQTKAKAALENQEVEENDYIRKTIKRLKKDQGWYSYGIQGEDINADGKEDVVIFEVAGNQIDLKTTVMVFIRRQDGELPGEPSRVLRLKGFPIELDYQKRNTSILKDIDKDGIWEIVLVEVDMNIFSVSSVLETVISRGMDFTLTIREFHKENGYSHRADFSIDVTTMLPMFQPPGNLIRFEADFNGDSLPELVVRRRAREMKIYLSSRETGFFEKESRLEFTVPDKGYVNFDDLNGDGISDIYVVNSEEARVTFILSSSSESKGALR